MDYLNRPKHQQRQDKRFVRTGLWVEFNHTRFSVINLSEGGLLLGDV
jgi:hypothetical protein